MFDELQNMHTRPRPFEFYTANDLWTDEHTSEQMISFHLNDTDVSSRNAAFIDRSVEWITSHFNVGAETKIVDFGCGPGLYTAGGERVPPVKLGQHLVELVGDWRGVPLEGPLSRLLPSGAHKLLGRVFIPKT